MVRLTQSLEHWLWENHREKLALIMFGHIEWCKTDEGKSYLQGGSNYREEDNERT